MSSDLERLESRLAYLERANTELSDVVYRQQRELDALRSRVAALLEQLATLTDESRGNTDDERPPHY